METRKSSCVTARGIPTTAYPSSSWLRVGVGPVWSASVWWGGGYVWRSTVWLEWEPVWRRGKGPCMDPIVCCVCVGGGCMVPVLNPTAWFGPCMEGTPLCLTF